MKIQRDPKLIALQFNECISNQDIEGLGRLMTEDHVFIDRDGNTTRSKESMLRSWSKFFEMFPDYKNRFERVQSRDNVVFMLGFAYWSEKNQYDRAIWIASIENDLVAEWRIYHDTEENRKEFGFS
jgi:ketosteroid isomerase-like protein